MEKNADNNWNRRVLESRIAARKVMEKDTPGAEEALLAFARWQGKTQEIGVDREAEKEKLHQVMDKMGPDKLADVKHLVGDIEDGLLSEFMVYSAKRAQEELKEMARELVADRGNDDPEGYGDDEPDDEPDKKRRRGRSR